MSHREATYPRPGQAATHRRPAAPPPRLALRLWLYRVRLRLLCRLAFAGRGPYHAG